MPEKEGSARIIMLHNMSEKEESARTTSLYKHARERGIS